MTDAPTDKIFQNIVGSLDFPMIIVTTIFGAQKAGCLVGFWTQCSIHPPRFLICSSEKNHTYSVLKNSDRIAVHFLNQEHMALAELFGGETGNSMDKFAKCKWHADDETGVPILDECATWFTGKIVERHKFGDHTGMIIEPLHASFEKGESAAMMFQQVKHLEPGHEP